MNRTLIAQSTEFLEALRKLGIRGGATVQNKNGHVVAELNDSAVVVKNADAIANLPQESERSLIVSIAGVDGGGISMFGRTLRIRT